MIDELISHIIAAKTGDKEFMLAMYYDGKWVAVIGNRSQHVPLGEAIAYGENYADFYAEGATATEALETLLAKMTVTAAA